MLQSYKQHAVGKFRYLKYWEPKAPVQDNTDQTTANGYTIGEKHKSPRQVIIMIITTRWSDHIHENNIKVKSRFRTYQL